MFKANQKKFPSIPEPTTDARSLHIATMSLKEGYEILTGQRRSSITAVTWEDLLRLGLIGEKDIPR